MPERILGLDIKSDSLTAVQVTSRLKGFEVTSCGHVAIDEEGGLGAGLESLAEQMALDADLCVSVLPGEQISYRTLVLPFKDAKKIRQTLAFELEAVVPFPVEDLIFDFTMVEQSEQSLILAACVKRALISDYVSRLNSVGLDPAVLDVNGAAVVSWLLTREDAPEAGLLLDLGGRWNTMVLYEKRRIALIRAFSAHSAGPDTAEPDRETNGETGGEAETGIEAGLELFCTHVRNTLHAFSCGGHEAVPQQIFVTGDGSLQPGVADVISGNLELPVKTIDLADDPRIDLSEDVTEAWKPEVMNNALALAMRDGKHSLGFNFRRGEFEITKKYFQHKKEIGKAAALLLVILCLLGARFGVDYYSLKSHYEQADKQIVEVFKRTFPDVKRVVDPVQQMRVKISELKASASLAAGGGSKGLVLDLLNDISQRVPETVDVRMARVVIDPDTVLMKGETDIFNTVDTLKQGLEPSPYFGSVTISSANLDKKTNRVRFEIKLERVEP